MPKAKVVFHTLIQDSQDYNSFDKNDNHMVSVIRFSLEIDDVQYSDMIVEARQPYGTNYEHEPIEVGRISGGYKGSWNHNGFTEICEEYCRHVFGSQGRIIKISGAKNLRVRNNIYSVKMERELDIPEDSASSC